MFTSRHIYLFRDVVKLGKYSSKLNHLNAAKGNIESLSVSNRENYYKNLGESAQAEDSKPPGWDEALPFDSLPGPKPLPLLGNTWRFLPYVGEYHNLPVRNFYEKLNSKYGNILILKGIFGRKPLVMLYDVNDMEKALRNEGPFPIRTAAESIVHYRTKIRKDVFQGVGGLVGLQGEEWFKFRSIVNPILMQPRTMQQYVGSMDKVAGDLIENMRYFSKTNENNEMPENFLNELYKWALESVGLVALDKRLGCLDLNAAKDSEGQKFISHVNEMFSLLYKLEILPPIWKFIETSTWKRFVKVMDFITETTQKYIDGATNKVLEDNVPEDKLSVTQKLVKENKIIAVSMVMDMLVGGIDTTGKTLAAALYFLAKNPDQQRSLREEMLRNLPDKNSPVTKEVLNNSPYLKAVIKETTRIAPIAVGNVRTSVKDLVLGGYRIPQGTDVLAANIITANSDIFKDFNKFLPDRWLRTTEDDFSHKNVHPFAYLPFGFGPRSCIGKRLANLELEVALAKIIRNLELSWHHEDMLFTGNFLYGVASPLKIKIKEA